MKSIIHLAALVLIVSASAGGIHAEEVREPGHDEKVYGKRLSYHKVEGLRLAGRPSAGGNTLALSSRHERRVWVLDIAKIERPHLLRQYSLEGHPGACGFWNGRLVILAAYQGLLVERKPQR